VLVVIHSAGFLRRPPALLFLALLALIVLGVWARVRLSARMAATFATKQRGFVPAGGASRTCARCSHREQSVRCLRRWILPRRKLRSRRR
jgi:hypothetical protein